ncbi:MAG: SDR family oxidoreductase [Spirochaetaceae bacterium]|nr:MAG: SDR family oxidoreductase [Spirochaetaceae bacterium]
MAKEKPFVPPNEMPPRPIQPLLTGQKALVTGASKGIGEGVAVALAQAGADVLLNYFSDPEGAEKTAEKVRKAGRQALVVQADVAVEEEVQSMVARMIEAFGRIDILINNSGIQLNAPFDKMTLAQWQRVIDINLTGQFLCAREAVRVFKRQGIDKSISYAMGKIIHISSVHDIIPWAGHVNYAAAKGGIMLLMKSIAQELAPLRIRVNSISPGAIRTPMNLEKLTTPESYRDLLSLIPYKRLGEAEDVGRAAVWLASDDSDYVHGAVLYVDGGMVLYPEFASGG